MEAKIKKLVEELEQSGGFSTKDKFLKLVDENLAFIYRTNEVVYTVLKGTESAKIHSFALNLPLYNPNPKDPESMKRHMAYQNIIIKWFLNLSPEKISNIKEEEKEESKKLIKKWYIKLLTETVFISCPNFLYDELVADLKATGEWDSDIKNGNKIRDITVHVDETECPDCSEIFEYEKDRGTCSCPTCGFEFAI